jgi:hypothetical protein
MAQQVLVPLRIRTLYWQEYSLFPSNTNQTGIEIVRPELLPITLILIWR